MTICPACGAETAYKTMCASCGASIRDRRDSIVEIGGAEVSSRRVMAVAVFLNFLTALVFADPFSLPGPLIAFGANVAAGVLWFRAGAAHLRSGNRGASSLSSLMVGVSVLLALGSLFPVIIISAIEADL